MASRRARVLLPALVALVGLAPRVAGAQGASQDPAHEGVTITPAPVTVAPEKHEGVTLTPLPSRGHASDPLAPPPRAPSSAAPSPPPATAKGAPPVAPRPLRPSVAPPGIAASFGDRGTIVLVGGASFGLAVSPQYRSQIGHAFDLGAAFEVFPFRHVSLGTVLSVAYDGYLDGERTLGFGVTERVGLVVPLARRARIWPRLGLTGSREVRERGADPGHASSIAVTTYLPFEIEPLPHLLVGLGPEARFDLRERLDGVSRPLGGRLGLSTEVLAWF